MGVTDALAALGSEPASPLDPVSSWAFRSTLERALERDSEGTGEVSRVEVRGIPQGRPPRSLGKEGD